VSAYVSPPARTYNSEQLRSLRARSRGGRACVEVAYVAISTYSGHDVNVRSHLAPYSHSIHDQRLVVIAQHHDIPVILAHIAPNDILPRATPLRSSMPPGFPYVNTTVQRSRAELRRPVPSESELGRASAVLRRDAGRAVLRALEERRFGEDGVYAGDQRVRLVVRSGGRPGTASVSSSSSSSS
jgi:hypothetical protein